MSHVAVLTIAAGRHDHLLKQVAGLQAQEIQPDLHVVVSMGDTELRDQQVAYGSAHGPRSWRTMTKYLPVTGGDLPLAAARNLGAQAAIDAGADVLIFLDVDCIPAATLVREYSAVASGAESSPTAGAGQHRAGPAIFGGDISYLAPPPPTGYLIDGLADLATPSPVRPMLAAGECRHEPRFELFWSLSFAMSAADFTTSGGFCENYTGYGAEDTDFAQIVKSQGGTLTWIGGASAYHQHHESAVPPVQHVEAIVRNAGVFYDRWGWWPMDSWLHAFAALGLVIRTGPQQRWSVVK